MGVHPVSGIRVMAALIPGSMRAVTEKRAWAVWAAATVSRV